MHHTSVLLRTPCIKTSQFHWTTIPATMTSTPTITARATMISACHCNRNASMHNNHFFITKDYSFQKIKVRHNN